MIPKRQDRLFLWLDRAFWGVWLTFPVYVWVVISDILGQAEMLAELAPDQAACVMALPTIRNFSLPGQIAFWSFVAVNFLFYAALLGMAHSVIRSCARGRLFVTPLVRMLWWIGLVITLFPVVELALSNLIQGLLFTTGDMPVFLPNLAFDVTVFGVGLLLLSVSVAMRQAMQLHRDAELTI